MKALTPLLRKTALELALAAGFCLTPWANARASAEQDKTTQEIASLFRAARKVISDHQALINDAEKADKGLTGDNVVTKAKENYQAAVGRAVADSDQSSLSGQAQAALLSAVREVMKEAQPLINEKGKGFKGFLPAVFARQVAEKFNAGMAGKAFIKLTAPKDYLRNRANRADEWETSVIETKFRSTDWEKGKMFAEASPHKGKKAFRALLPEYYGQSCLDCHGDPKGTTDITGGIKEGGKLDELGGAISVVLYEN